MQGKQVLLTGGTGGLGLDVMRVLLAQGAKITAPYRNEKTLEPLKAAFTTVELENVRLVETNLSDEQLLKQLVNTMERVDALIHTVGDLFLGFRGSEGYARCCCASLWQCLTLYGS